MTAPVLGRAGVGVLVLGSRDRRALDAVLAALGPPDEWTDGDVAIYRADTSDLRSGVRRIRRMITRAMGLGVQLERSDT